MMTYGVTVVLGVYVGVSTFGEVFNPAYVPEEHKKNALFPPKPATGAPADKED